MTTILINGREIEIGAGQALNAIQAAQLAGVEIPHYCWHPALSVVASCRMCLVEAGERKPDGTLAMLPKLVPACQTPIKDGLVIVTNSPQVESAREQVLEFLLLNHPLDCPVCDQAGECWLQDYSYRYGRAHSRLQEPKLQKHDKDDIGDQITLFTDRCVMCTRCVRFTREISGTRELQVIDRGSHAEIDIFPGEPCNNQLAGNVVDLCPVGALCSKDFLYQQRVWWLDSKASVCPACSTGCSIRVDQNEDHVYRLRPRFNPQAQGHFMCDEGRFGFKYVSRPDRLVRPEWRTGGNVAPLDWPDALAEVRTAIESAVARRPDTVAAVLSPWMTCEEAWLLAKFLKDLSSDVRLALGPVRVTGEDDIYPRDIHGRPASREQATFIIRAEKCPNRRGVAAVLEHFEGEVVPFEDLLAQVARGAIEALYLAGGDPEPWITRDQAAALGRLSLLIVQDLLPSEASRMAHFVLPGAAFVEKDGTFVNHAGLAQAIRRAVRPPGAARADGRILWELAGRRGLFHAPTLRREMAAAISAFAPLAGGDPGETGIFLALGPPGSRGLDTPDAEHQPATAPPDVPLGALGRPGATR
jgi:NADH-quinone oxidoreductase subunit G